MQLVPAIDVRRGQAVRLAQGDYTRELFATPLAAYVEAVIAATTPSLLHIVDLDGARVGQFDLDILATLLPRVAPIQLQVSGGIRSSRAARAVLDAGAHRIIMGTAAFATPHAMVELHDALGDALVVAIDIKDGQLATHGWLADSGISVTEAAQRCIDAGVTRIHATAVARDGMMRGPDFDLYRTLCATGLLVTAAGGVRNEADLAELAAIGCEAAVMGTALAQQLGVAVER